MERNDALPSRRGCGRVRIGPFSHELDSMFQRPHRHPYVYNGNKMAIETIRVKHEETG